MRLSIAVLALACTTPLARGQCGVDLVPNGSFEQATGCPTANGQLELAAPWVLPTTGTSDYFNPCDRTPDNVGVPDNAVGFQEAFEGSSYAGFIALSPPKGAANYREYIQAPLLGTGLVADQTYRFWMRWSLAEDSSAATDRLGAHFSASPIGATDWLPLAVTPQVETPAGTFLDELVEWETFTETFVAAGGEQYVTIGNFHDFATSGAVPAGLGPAPPLQVGTAYYYIDVVSLLCEPCAHPPDDLAAWWTLDETVGTLAADIVNGIDGLHVGGSLPTPGYVDGAHLFAGNGVVIPSDPDIEGTHPLGLSLDLLVRPDALGTAQVLLSKLASIADPGYALVLEADGTVTFLMIDDTLSTVSASSTAALSVGEWSHLVVSLDRDDPAGLNVYVDGEVATFDPTTATGSLSNPEPLRFAQDAGAGLGADFVGTLDEVCFYHRALFPPEVEYLLGPKTSGKCKIFLELPMVEASEATPDVDPTVGTTGTLITSTGGSGATGGLVGTFTFSVRGLPRGTHVGGRVSDVEGPLHPVVLSPQPMQVQLGHPVPVRLELDVPRQLFAGLAAYSVTTTHLETGRRFVSRGAIRGNKWRGTGLQPR